MNRLRGVMAAAFLMVLALPCLTQESVQGPVSLKEAIDIALRNQVSLLTGQNNVDIAKNRLVQSRSSYYPQVSITNNTFRASVDDRLGRSDNGTALIVSQNIYDSGFREADVQGSVYGVRETQYALQRTAQAVVFNVSLDYYEVLRSKRLAEVQESDVKYNEELRKQIEANVEAGKSARADVLPVIAQLANAQVNLLRARNAIRTSLVQLQNTMGLFPQPGFDVQEVQDVPEPKVVSLEDYKQQALTQRPDVYGAEAGTGAARVATRTAGLFLYPRFQVSADYLQGITGDIVSNDASITGSIVFDVFDGGANRAAFRQAQEAQANAVVQEEQLRKDITSDVEQAYLNLTNARERLAVSQVSLDAAQSNYVAQRERYREGIAITLDLLNAQVQLITAQSNLIQARYDYYDAIAQMEFASGQQGETNGAK